MIVRTHPPTLLAVCNKKFNVKKHHTWTQLQTHKLYIQIWFNKNGLDKKKQHKCAYLIVSMVELGLNDVIIGLDLSFIQIYINISCINFIVFKNNVKYI